MSKISEFIAYIKSLCTVYQMHLESDNNGEFRVFTDNASGIYIIIQLREPLGFSFYFLQRTYNYEIIYPGDRSDAHVILSLMFTSFLKLVGPGISCAQYDVGHPVVRDEIWGRYIMPFQGPAFLLGNSTWEQVEKRIHELFYIVSIWRSSLWGTMEWCNCEECSKANDSRDVREYDLPEEIPSTISKYYKNVKRYNYGRRQMPDWSYYYNISNEVTIIKSSKLSVFLQEALESNKREQKVIQGINGELIIDGELNNFVKFKHIKEAKNILINLKGQKDCEFKTVLLENMMLAVSAPYIVALGRLCGYDEFNAEKEIVRQRHNEESRVLFPVTLFEWCDNVCPDQFEGLIKALLEREPNVSMVRKPAPINQGDKGRDLLIEWHVINPSVISEINPPTSLIKVVGQCKASNSAVGKDKVQDIRDTVETHNASGYFLAVSTQITSPLTEKLESLSAKGIWAYWWNRDDIELRLSKNNDLIPRFPKVVKAKNKVKFVEGF